MLFTSLPCAHDETVGLPETARPLNTAMPSREVLLCVLCAVSCVRYPFGSGSHPLALASFAFCLPCCRFAVRVIATITTRPTSNVSDALCVFALVPASTTCRSSSLTRPRSRGIAGMGIHLHASPRAC
jgi:hypothetical protein